MINFHRILFPADLSGPSREAAAFVAAMAARFNSKVFLLHCLEPRPSYYPIAAVATPAALKHSTETREVTQAKLEAFVSDFFSGVAVQPVLTEGDAANCIATFARENDVDLIMMPTHGYGSFRRLLLGSVTAKVLHDVECPVWTGVHADEMWSHIGTGWQRFLCAVDDDLRDIPLLKWAAQFANEQGAVLQVIHAAHATASNPGHESASLRDLLVGVARERLSRLQAGAGTNFDIQLVLGHVSDVVRQAALDHRADLILIGRGAIQTGFGRLRSSAYAVIREAPCPVISL
ncbi:MAG TPA: universal stress protein [Bryobacteraceae bacterium]|nr:universal stress protein [Bryobacteraceae bacterium]